MEGRGRSGGEAREEREEDGGEGKGEGNGINSVHADLLTTHFYV